MTIPPKIQAITKHIVGLYSGARRSQPISPPVMIKGARGTGKSWILNSVYEELKSKQGKTGVVPVRIPLHLNATYLVQDIVREIELSRIGFLENVSGNERGSEHVFLLFIEEMDSLFNTSSEGLPNRAFGRGASQFSQMQHAAELRSFLIENSQRISLLTTANLDVRFTEDPEQPFYNFFNVFNLDPLDPNGAMAYFFEKIQIEESSLSFLKTLRSINSNWIRDLTDGKILHLNFLADSLKKIDHHEVSSRISIEERLEKILLIYFLKLVPFFELELSRLSYQEKLFIDLIVSLQDGFNLREIQGFSSNMSMVSSRLRDKMLIEIDGEGHSAKHKMTSTALKSYLRFFKKSNMLSVIKPGMRALKR